VVLIESFKEKKKEKESLAVNRHVGCFFLGEEGRAG